jgi:Protein of unknown function (DUF2997)
METLEFIIRPDGRVEERVTGIVGSSCEAVTAAIEAHLGIVASRELTSENFAQSLAVSSDRVSQTETIEYSQW